MRTPRGRVATPNAYAHFDLPFRASAMYQAGLFDDPAAQD
jgi:hypothetical protein